MIFFKLIFSWKMITDRIIGTNIDNVLITCTSTKGPSLRAYKRKINQEKVKVPFNNPILISSFLVALSTLSKTSFFVASK